MIFPESLAIVDKLESIEFSKEDIDDLKERRTQVNDKLRKIKSEIIVTDSYKIENTNKSVEDSICEFFLFPIAVLVNKKGDQEIDYGFRLGAVKQIKKRKYDFTSFDISNKTLKSKDWLNSNSFKRVFKNSDFISHYDVYITVLYTLTKSLKKSGLVIMETENLGWIRGPESWHYTPLAIVKDTNLVFDIQKLYSSFFTVGAVTDTPKVAFDKTLSLINRFDKRISIPLFSFTLLSLFTSLINYNTPAFPKFILCLHGGRSAKYRTQLVNIFCNLYSRKRNMSSLDERYHSNLSSSDEELKNKALTLRDGTFIVNTNHQRKISGIKKILHQADIKTMYLILSEEAVEQDYVLNINLSESSATIPSNEDYYSEIESFQITIEYFVTHYAMAFSLKGNSKNKITKLFERMYDENYKLLESKVVDFDVNMLHYFSLLLVGWQHFVAFGTKKGLIQEDESKELMRTALQSFISFSDDTPKEEIKIERKQNLPSDFLQNLLSLVVVNSLDLLSTKKSIGFNKEIDIGWIDDDNDNLLYIYNGVFRKLDTIKGMDKRHPHSFEKNKSLIVKALQKEKIFISPIDDYSIKGGQITKMEVAKNIKGVTIKALILDKEKALQYLNQ
ncbi:hypothetical protein [Paenibacillus rhizophilus]|uniref:DUF927 domain-containing protein n=1 Tax=Paenibacillus rhizophilus TaxID=1850366 RepID=A0A3N9P8C3_9BACL|nr:hypothetical protein [Paenibacillus rhizophilus]RQW11587.1 hypothetical protein EH198_11235 [Paenibacillus rhizophilus]